MRKMPQILMLWGVVCLVAYCLSCAARTSINSRVRGEYGERSYRSIIVYGQFADYGLQEAFEKKVVGKLLNKGLTGLAWHELVFPGDEPDIDSLIGVTGADAILLVVPGNSGFSQTFIPRSSSTSSSGTVTPDYHGGFKIKSTSRTSSSGGYNVNKPWAQFSAGLIDCKLGDMVWTATGSTSGNAYANWKTVVRSMGGKTVVKMDQDGMLATD